MRYDRRELASNLSDLELRNAGEGRPFITMVGHAAVFNRLSDPLWDRAGEFRERIEPGAFTDVLKQSPDVRMLVDHLSHTVVARTPDTLELRETDHGLRVWAKMPAELSDARELYTRMKHGLVSQMSFGFTIDEQIGDGFDPTGIPVRAIKRVGSLFDVSPVTYPAYPDTDAALGSAELRMWIPKDAQLRRDYSQAEREALAKKGHAMPDGSFPIVDREDLENAIHLAGHAKDPGAAKAFIKKRAEALGLSNLIPDTWRSHEPGGEDARHAVGHERVEVPTADGDPAGESATRSRKLEMVRLRANARRCVLDLGIDLEAA